MSRHSEMVSSIGPTARFLASLSRQPSVLLFRLFGVPLIARRAFNAQEDRFGASAVVLISETLWRSRFAADPKIVGKTMSLGGASRVVIGVVSARFDFRDFGPAPEVWIPFQLDPNSRDHGHYFLAAGRLKSGVTLQQAKARLDASAAACAPSSSGC